MENLGEGFLWYLVFLFSTVVHEASHAFMAMKLGDDTAYLGGQVTLDPLPHIRREPVGTVVVPLISFLLGGWMIGWASTPYNYNWARRFPKRSAMMALAGPLSNLALVVLAAVVIHIGIGMGLFFAPPSIDFSHITAASQGGLFSSVAVLVSILFSLNLLLFLFNLIPFPPLDGSGILPLFLKEELALKYMALVRNPGFSLFGLILAWNTFDYIFSPVLRLSLNLLYPGAGYH